MKTTSRQAPPARGVADRLHSAAIHLLRRLRVEDKAMGLSAPRASALSVIVFRGPVTMSALAEAEQVRPPTITRLVDGLGPRAPRGATHAGSCAAISGRSAGHCSRRRLDGAGPFSELLTPRRRSQVVRQRSAKPRFVGSIPTGASRGPLAGCIILAWSRATCPART